MADVVYTINGVTVVENGTVDWTINGVSISETTDEVSAFGGSSQIIGGGILSC